MQSWQKIWREGFVPAFTPEGLASLKRALERDDRRLIQGATLSPPPLQCVEDWPVEAACAVAWAAAGSDPTSFTVGDLELRFAEACWNAGLIMGEDSAACRWFLNLYDETPRNEMRRLLLAEVNLALNRFACEPPRPAA